MVAGLTVVLGTAWFQRGGQTPSVGQDARFTPLALPGAEAVAEVPVIGALYSELLSGHNLLVYLALAAVPLTWWLVYRTRFGLRLRDRKSVVEGTRVSGRVDIGGRRFL